MEEKMDVDMAGKVVLVTGASQGLGEIIAIEFGKVQADVIVNYQSQKEKAETVADKIRGFGQRASAIQCNVADSGDVKQMVEKIVDEFGKIDVLVNNAAVNPKRPEGKTPIYEISDEEYDLVMGVNLKGAFNCTREVLKLMLEQGSGSIVSISSTSGHMGNGAPVGAPYCISKAGIICLTKAAALDVATKGIRINNVAPGPLEGPTNQKNTPAVNKAMADKIPIKRIGKREEVAWAVIFLASELSGNTTGETLNVNGGWYMP
jgi:3-oxoacyl-[acyl-carrier protein] reductase